MSQLDLHGMTCRLPYRCVVLVVMVYAYQDNGPFYNGLAVTRAHACVCTYGIVHWIRE